MSIKWIDCNCSQCWKCKNCTAQYEENLETVIRNSNSQLRFLDLYYRDEKVLLPYCKVMDLKMTYVNKFPCDCFVRKNND